MLNLESSYRGRLEEDLIGVRGVKKNNTKKRKLEHILSQTVPELESDLGLTDSDKNVCFDFLFRYALFLFKQNTKANG